MIAFVDQPHHAIRHKVSQEYFLPQHFKFHDCRTASHRPKNDVKLFCLLLSTFDNVNKPNSKLIIFRYPPGKLQSIRQITSKVCWRRGGGRGIIMRKSLRTSNWRRYISVRAKFIKFLICEFRPAAYKFASRASCRDCRFNICMGVERTTTSDFEWKKRFGHKYQSAFR